MEHNPKQSDLWTFQLFFNLDYETMFKNSSLPITSHLYDILYCANSVQRIIDLSARE